MSDMQRGFAFDSHDNLRQAPPPRTFDDLPQGFFIPPPESTGNSNDEPVRGGTRKLEQQTLAELQAAIRGIRGERKSGSRVRTQATGKTHTSQAQISESAKMPGNGSRKRRHGEYDPTIKQMGYFQEGSKRMKVGSEVKSFHTSEIGVSWCHGLTAKEKRSKEKQMRLDGTWNDRITQEQLDRMDKIVAAANRRIINNDIESFHRRDALVDRPSKTAAACSSKVRFDTISQDRSTGEQSLLLFALRSTSIFDCPQIELGSNEVRKAEASNRSVYKRIKNVYSGHVPPGRLKPLQVDYAREFIQGLDDDSHQNVSGSHLKADDHGQSKPGQTNGGKVLSQPENASQEFKFTSLFPEIQEQVRSLNFVYPPAVVKGTPSAGEWLAEAQLRYGEAIQQAQMASSKKRDLQRAAQIRQSQGSPLTAEEQKGLYSKIAACDNALKDCSNFMEKFKAQQETFKKRGGQPVMPAIRERSTALPRQRKATDIPDRKVGTQKKCPEGRQRVKAKRVDISFWA